MQYNLFVRFVNGFYYSSAVGDPTLTNPKSSAIRYVEEFSRPQSNLCLNLRPDKKYCRLQ